VASPVLTLKRRQDSRPEPGIATASDAGYLLGDGVTDWVGQLLSGAERGPSFGNGRTVRNLLEATVANQATRIVELVDAPSEVIRELRVADLPRFLQKVSQVLDIAPRGCRGLGQPRLPPALALPDG
jgi:hypothetical protein